MKPTLLLLAAGMGSRYGGIKQLDRFGPNGETIMDYSLYDAIRAGFGKVVFIIRDELKPDFEEIFGSKLAGKIEVAYAIQALDSYVPADLGPVTRTKPWGTGHAMLCAWPYVNTPFAVLNADDFYGPESFRVMGQFLSTDTNSTQHSMVAYSLKNTLSDFGSVSRGVCEVDENDLLKSVVERVKIYRKEAGLDSSVIVYEEADELTVLDEDTPVSMNFWGFKPEVFPLVQAHFESYARSHFDTPKTEFYIPTVVERLISQQAGTCKVFRSEADWFGVTYPEDKPTVQQSLRALHTNGTYPPSLW